MKNTRKLIPALAMLLVSAVMMSTASFAWFTMNSTVKAEGMQITAVAPASLWITDVTDNTQDSDWKSAVGFVNEVTVPDEGMAPVQVKGGTTTTGGAINSTAAGYEDWDGWVFEELLDASIVDNSGNFVSGSTPTFVDTTSYYKDTFLIKLDGKVGATDVPVHVRVAVSQNAALGSGRTEADDIWKALRVAVVVDGQILIFEFADGDLNAHDATELKYTDDQELVELTPAGDPKKVVVYSWIEGEDDDCINANAFNCDTFNITVEFLLPNALENDGD